MKKALLLVFLILSSVVVITGCSSKEKQTGEISEAEAKDIKEFTNTFNNTLDQSNKLLSSFNTALDGLYTKTLSDEQFGQIMKKNIDASRALMSTIDNYNASPYVTVNYQNLVVYLNTQHQLFLNSIDMVNSERIIKNELRQNYLDVKRDKNDLEYKFLYGEDAS